MIDNETKHLNEQNEKILQLKKENDDALNEISKLNDENLKIKDDPLRFAKNADMLNSANTVMNQDLQQILDDVAKKDKVLQDQTAENNHLNSKLTEYEQQIETLKKEIERNNFQIKRFQEDISKLREEYNSLLAEKYKHETELKGLTKEYRRHNDIVNTLRKLIDQDKKIYKKEER